MRVIWDIETIKNAYTVTFLNVDTLEVSQFVIHKDRDDSVALVEFLRRCTEMIGFNSLSFDWPVTIYLLSNELPKKPDTLARRLYKEAQDTIEAKEKEGFPKRVDMKIPQLDLFEVWGFSNMAKTCSLKWLAINLGMETVLDMPIPHDSEITIDQIPMVLEYNLIDVMVTYELWKRSESKIKMRTSLSLKYGIDMKNFPDPKIGETIVLKKLSERTNTPMATLKKSRTFRKELKLSDCILPSVSFKSPEFQKIYDEFAKMVVTENTVTGELVSVFDGVPYYFGLGGLHACRGNGVYRNVGTCDVGGYYPTLSVSQRFRPAQFGEDFVEVYSQIAKERALYAKGTPESTGLKLAQNGVFGKSNSIYSPFYDPKFFFQITINGQLLLAMLCERITMMGAGRIIMANTDGIEVDVLDQEKYKWICECWEKKFGLKLEHGTYRMMAIKDVNNYLAISPEGKVKTKGVYKTNEDLLRDEELHKDFSHNVIKRAIISHFLKGTPIEETINSCEDIKEFLIGDRAKAGKFVVRELRNGELITTEMQRHIRYYVSKGGGSLYRVGTKGADSQVLKGFQITLMNTLGTARFINKNYYIRQCRQLLDGILLK